MSLCLSLFFYSWISKIYLSAIYSTQRKSDSTPPIAGRAKLFVDACRTPVALDSSWFPTCSCLTASSAPSIILVESSITFVESATHGHLRLTIQCLCGRLPRSAQFVLLLSFHVLRSKRLLCAIYTIIQHIAIFTAHLGDCLVFLKIFTRLLFSRARFKGSPTELSVTSIWALPVRGGGSKPLPGWFGALF